MHPLDLSPRTNSLRSTYYSTQSSARNGANHNSYHETYRKTSNKLGNKREQDHGKRGRPRADILTTLMVEGSSSRSKIRCIKCGRAFPREKSLQAHMRTHTGERPYLCDYPGCSKAFCQSGQLKTHQRLHTGEKPFSCNVEGCASRFTHANRHCATHPYAGLKRLKIDLTQVSSLNDDQSNAEVKKWIEKYIKQSKEKLNSKLTPRKSSMHDTILKKSSVLETIPKKSSIQETVSTTQISPVSPLKGVRTTNTHLSLKISESPSVKFKSDEDKISPLDLTRNKYSPSLPPLSPITPPPISTNHGPPPPLIPIIHELSAPVPFALTLHNSRHTMSSTKSQSPEESYSSRSSITYSSYSSASSSSSSCLSSSTTTSITSPYRQHFAKHPAPEKKGDFYPYVLSSQMILQGPSNFGSAYYSHCLPIPVSYQPVSSSMPEKNNAGVKAKETEKDRYISALALIELSKG